MLNIIDNEQLITLSYLLKNRGHEFNHDPSFIIKNGLAGVFLDSVKDLESINDIYVYDKIKGVVQKQKILYQLQSIEFFKIIRILNEKKINFILLKGWPLAYKFYSKQYHRPRADVDILIKDDCSKEIKECFSMLGYFNPRNWEPKYILDQFCLRKELGPNHVFEIDFHLKISNNKLIQKKLSNNYLFEKSRYSHNLGALVPNDEILLCHSLIHLFNNYHNRDYIKLIWIYDIILILESLNSKQILDVKASVINLGLQTHLNQVLQLLTKCGYDRIDLVDSLYSTELKNSDLDYLFTQPSKKGLILENLMNTAGFSNKLGYIREVAFPDSDRLKSDNSEFIFMKIYLKYITRIIRGLFK